MVVEMVRIKRDDTTIGGSIYKKGSLVPLTSVPESIVELVRNGAVRGTEVVSVDDAQAAKAIAPPVSPTAPMPDAEPDDEDAEQTSDAPMFDAEALLTRTVKELQEIVKNMTEHDELTALLYEEEGNRDRDGVKDAITKRIAQIDATGHAAGNS